MKTGARFWQLIGLVFFILAAYGLGELSDAVVAKEKDLNNQQLLLSRQEVLLHNNNWIENLHSVENVHKAWLSYLPVENSATFAKARLLSDIRVVTKNAGFTGVSVTATEAEGGDKSTSSSGTTTAQRQAYQFGSDKKKTDTLPAGVQMIKLTVTGRFDPASFNKLLLALEEEQRFAVIERVTIRSAQLELGIRCYWRLAAGPRADKALLPLTEKAI